MIKCILTAALTIIVSLSAFANDGEKTNCRMENVGSVAIYQGYESCKVSGYTLSKYFLPTTIQRQLITEWVNGSYKQCWADIPFSQFETVTKEVCDYKPTASFDYNHEGYATRFSLRADDSDGSIVSKKVWLDNVLISGTSQRVVNWDNNIHYQLKAEVTDNDGYTKTVYGSFRVKSLAEVLREKCGGNFYC